MQCPSSHEKPLKPKSRGNGIGYFKYINFICKIGLSGFVHYAVPFNNICTYLLHMLTQLRPTTFISTFNFFYSICSTINGLHVQLWFLWCFLFCWLSCVRKANKKCKYLKALLAKIHHFIQQSFKGRLKLYRRDTVPQKSEIALQKPSESLLYWIALWLNSINKSSTRILPNWFSIRGSYLHYVYSVRNKNS